MGYLPRRAVDLGGWYTADIKAEKAEPFKYFDLRHGTTRFDICPSGFQYCFCPVFPHFDVFTPPFREW